MQGPLKSKLIFIVLLQCSLEKIFFDIGSSYNLFNFLGVHYLPHFAPNVSQA